jgi:uncharacterized protein (DUF1778 family)
MQNANEAAIKTIQAHSTWILGDRDRDFLIEALLYPREPSDYMKDAVKRYKECGGKS